MAPSDCLHTNLNAASPRWSSTSPSERIIACGTSEARKIQMLFRCYISQQEKEKGELEKCASWILHHKILSPAFAYLYWAFLIPLVRSLSLSAPGDTKADNVPKQHSVLLEAYLVMCGTTFLNRCSSQLRNWYWTARKNRRRCIFFISIMVPSDCLNTHESKPEIQRSSAYWHYNFVPEHILLSTSSWA